FGLYKVTNNLNNKYFYLDFRDYREGFYVHYLPNTPSYKSSIDIWIKFKGNKFQYSVEGDDSIYFNDIIDGQLLSLWEIKEKGNPLTDLFPDYWENCLALINDGNNHPKLVWGPYPETDF